MFFRLLGEVIVAQKSPEDAEWGLQDFCSAK